MKMKFIVPVMLAASVALVNCKGDKGDLGPKGDTGALGAQGPAGTPAQVIYSNWTDINTTAIDLAHEHPAEEDNFDLKQTIAAPKLTTDIVTKGVVLVYVKNSEGAVSAVSGIGVAVAEKYDTDLDGVKDYITTWVGTTYKVGEVKFLAQSDQLDVNGNPISYLNLSGATIRYVLISGVEAGRVANVSKMPYKEVAKMYNIKD